MIEKLGQSASLVRFQGPCMAQFLRRKYRRSALILGGVSLLAAMFAVWGSSNWSHGNSDCMAKVVPVDRILPTLTIYSHLPKPNDEDVPHYIRTRARSCFPKLAAHFRETDIPTHLRKGRPPYLEGDPVAVYRGGERRWLFEVRSREIQGRLLGFVSVGAEKGDLQSHGIGFRTRAQAEEIVLSKAKVLTQQRVLKVLPGTKPYGIKNIPSFVVRFADEGGVVAGIGILSIGESSGPSIGQTLSEAIAAAEDAGTVANVRH